MAHVDLRSDEVSQDAVLDLHGDGERQDRLSLPIPVRVRYDEK